MFDSKHIFSGAESWTRSLKQGTRVSFHERLLHYAVRPEERSKAFRLPEAEGITCPKS